MGLTGNSSTFELEGQLRASIEAALPGSRAAVEGKGGHFAIQVVWDGFEGLGRVQRQRSVYRAIKELMAGSDAPVHAVDRLVTQTPAENVDTGTC